MQRHDMWYVNYSPRTILGQIYLSSAHALCTSIYAICCKYCSLSVMGFLEMGGFGGCCVRVDTG